MTGDQINELKTGFAVLNEKVDSLGKHITDIKSVLCNVNTKDEMKPFCLKFFEDHFVTRKEYMPIARAVYGGMALLLSGVVGAILALVINHQQL